MWLSQPQVHVVLRPELGQGGLAELRWLLLLLLVGKVLSPHEPAAMHHGSEGGQRHHPPHTLLHGAMVRSTGQPQVVALHDNAVRQGGLHCCYHRCGNVAAPKAVPAQRQSILMLGRRQRLWLGPRLRLPVVWLRLRLLLRLLLWLLLWLRSGRRVPATGARAGGADPMATCARHAIDCKAPQHVFVVVAPGQAPQSCEGAIKASCVRDEGVMGGGRALQGCIR